MHTAKFAEFIFTFLSKLFYLIFILFLFYTGYTCIMFMHVYIQINPCVCKGDSVGYCSFVFWFNVIVIIIFSWTLIDLLFCLISDSDIVCIFCVLVRECDWHSHIKQFSSSSSSLRFCCDVTGQQLANYWLCQSILCKLLTGHMTS